MKGFFKLENKPQPKKQKKQSNKQDCNSCGLHKNCITPKMKPTGYNKKDILILGEAPGKSEDEKGIQLIGRAGQLLRKVLRQYDINLDRDCVKTNILICRPPKNRTPTNKEINCCRHNLFKTIDEYKPKKIIVLGKIALQGLLGYRTSITGIKKWTGHQIPDKELNTWIFPTYHPSHLLRNENNNVLRMKFEENIKTAIEWNENFPIIPEVEIITEIYPAKIYLESLLQYKPDIAIDYETTGKKPQAEGHEIVSIGISDGIKSVAFPIFYEDKEFMKLLRKVLQNPSIKKIAHNLKHEDCWTRFIFKYNIKGWKWDTMIASHILDNRGGTKGLDFQTYVNFGILNYGGEIEKYKKSKDELSNSLNEIKEAPLKELLKYNAKDALFTFMLHEKQQPKFNKKLLQAYNLFHDGILELSKVESNGVHMDTHYYIKIEKHLTRRIDRFKNKIQNSEEIKKYNKEFNINSNPQLKELLFNILGYKPTKTTKKGNPSTDIEALEKINTPFVKNILKYRKLLKIKNTYIKNFVNEIVNGVMYPNYNLHIARSFRSSSNSPNLQNIPIRDEEAQRITRSGIIPRPGRQILEIDGKSIEVCLSACCHKDPVMIDYINNPDSDMHRDMAMGIFKKDKVTKQERYLAKNGFVFPQFYGDYWGNCSENIWDRMEQESKKHLSMTYKQFQKHIEQIEYRFWNDKFKVYTQWKKDEWKIYQRKGYVELLSGFRCYDIMDEKQVWNRPIQGPAFHVWLWCLIQINRQLNENKFETKILGQIHDSTLFDLVPDEFEDLKVIIKKTMTDVQNHYDWLIVPLTVEAEITPIDGNWTTKKEIKI
jgi:DNA polymerase-1